MAGSKSDGKQGEGVQTDCGAHAEFQKASSPPSVKKMAQGTTKYKHR